MHKNCSSDYILFPFLHAFDGTRKIAPCHMFINNGIASSSAHTKRILAGFADKTFHIQQLWLTSKYTFCYWGVALLCDTLLVKFVKTIAEIEDSKHALSLSPKLALRKELTIGTCCTPVDYRRTSDIILYAFVQCVVSKKSYTQRIPTSKMLIKSLQTWKFSAFQLISAFFIAQIYALSFIFSPIWAILPWFQAIFQLYWAFSVFLTKEHFEF